jgi:hypothetical protein
MPSRVKCASTLNGGTAGSQLVPPGLNMISLPWAEDIRYPEMDIKALGTSSFPVANEHQVPVCNCMCPKPSKAVCRGLLCACWHCFDRSHMPMHLDMEAVAAGP